MLKRKKNNALDKMSLNNESQKVRRPIYLNLTKGHDLLFCELRTDENTFESPLLENTDFEKRLLIAQLLSLVDP